MKRIFIAILLTINFSSCATGSFGNWFNETFGISQSAPERTERSPSDESLRSERNKLRQEGLIAIGMSPSEVRSTLGSPYDIEVAGSPSLGNQRWIYRTGGTRRVVYFESGRVAGWHFPR